MTCCIDQKTDACSGFGKFGTVVVALSAITILVLGILGMVSQFPPLAGVGGQAMTGVGAGLMFALLIGAIIKCKCCPAKESISRHQSN